MNRILSFSLRPPPVSLILKRIKRLFTPTGQLAGADFNTRSVLVHKRDWTGHESGKIAWVSSLTRDISERRRAEDRIKALHDINLAVTSTLDLATILQILLEKIDVLLPYAAAHIRLVNKSTGHIEPIACHNIDQAKWKAGAEAIQHSIHRTIVQSKRPMILRNLQQDERVSRKDFYRQHGLVSYIGLPLIVKEEVIGVLSLLTKEQHEFTGEEIAFAETLAKQASVAIHNSQLYEQ